MTGIAVDSSGNGNDGTYASAEYIVPGILPVASSSGALDCSGGTGGTVHNQRVDIPTPAFDWTGPWTFEFWVQSSTAVGGVFVSTDLSSVGAVNIEIVPSGGDDEIHVLTSNTFSVWSSGLVTIVDGTPHYVVVTYDGANIAMYLDDVLLTLAATGNPMDVFTASTSAISSANGTNEACLAILDEVAIYSTQLGSTAIGNHYAAAAASFAAYSAAVLADTPTNYYQFGLSASGWHVGVIAMGA